MIPPSRHPADPIETVQDLSLRGFREFRLDLGRPAVCSSWSSSDRSSEHAGEQSGLQIANLLEVKPVYPVQR